MGETLLAVHIEGRSESGKVAGFASDGIDRKVAHDQGGGFAFELGKFRTELAESFVKRSVQFLELLHRKTPAM